MCRPPRHVQPDQSSSASKQPQDNPTSKGGFKKGLRNTVAVYTVSRKDTTRVH